MRIARKHVGWYIAKYDQGREFRGHFNAIDDAAEQLNALEMFYSRLRKNMISSVA